ncbi:hypothetical protein ABC337_07165 [Arthrobacter sp. 1P04PC]|uniref:hypothetical protein n=1 Tax=unclassified Arthrobacter TaxID=235627 RepID=UPI0039A36B04
MNHKLRVLVRVDADTGHVTLEASGCLTQDSYPALLHIMRRSSRLAAGADVTLDLYSASHLDPEILLSLRESSSSRAEGFALELLEPADLPVCLAHVGPAAGELADDAEVDASIDEQLGDPYTTADADEDPVDTGERIQGLELAQYFEGTLDPAVTVRALSDDALGQLADALYRHLDTAHPYFGALTWYDLAAEELQHRYRREDGLAGAGAAELTSGLATNVAAGLTPEDISAMDLAAEVLAGEDLDEAGPEVTERAAAELAVRAPDPSPLRSAAVVEGDNVEEGNDDTSDGERTAGPVSA